MQAWNGSLAPAPIRAELLKLSARREPDFLSRRQDLALLLSNFRTKFSTPAVVVQENGLSVDNPPMNFQAIHSLYRAVVTYAASLAVEGHPDEAVLLCLPLLSLGRNVAVAGSLTQTWTGNNIQSVAFKSIVQTFDCGKWTRTETWLA